MEEHIYVLDFVPYSTKYNGQGYVQGIGEAFFTLLEVSIKEGKVTSVGDKVYVGKDASKRTIVDKIKRRLRYDDLSTSAKENLFNVVRKIVEANEERFVSFINHAGPLSVRVHQLELIPGIGKKNIELIIREREKEPFKNFDDVKSRVPSWQDPVGSFAYRIVEELSKKERHYFFVLPSRQS